MAHRWKVLFFQCLLFLTGNCLAATTDLNDYLQPANSDMINTLNGSIRSSAEDLNWSLDLGLTTYQNKLETGDKATLFRSNLEFILANHVILGGGINFGYAALEKLTSFEPHVQAGFQWDRAEIRLGLLAPQYRQGASPSQPSAGNVIEEQDYTVKLEGTMLELRAQLAAWLEARASWTELRADSDFRSRSTGQVGTQWAARRFGPIVSTVATIPEKYQIYQLTFHPAENIDFDFQHNRSEEEITGDWSADTSGLLVVRIGPFWSVGYGLGESSYQAQSQRYAIIQLGYRFSNQ